MKRCRATTWDPGRGIKTTCRRLSGHIGPHDDHEILWRDGIVPPKAETERARVFALVKAEPWSTCEDVARELPCTPRKAANHLGVLHNQGKVERRAMLGKTRKSVFAYRVTPPIAGGE